MKNKNLSGITFSVNDSSGNNLALNIFKTIVLLLGWIVLSLSFFDMLEIKVDIICVIIPCVIMLLQNLIKSKKKLYSLLNVIIFLALIIFLIINFSDFINGAKLVFNNIFEISEKYQLYLYDKFDITVEEISYSKCKMIFVLCVSIIISSLMSYALSKNRSWIFLIIIVGAVVFEIYFGIAPSYLFNIIFFALFIFLSVINRINNFSVISQITVLFVVVALLFSVVTYAVYPSDFRESNPAIHQFSENIRDIFDNGENTVSNQQNNSNTSDNESNPDSSQFNDGEDAESEQGSDNGIGGSKKHASNAVTVSVNFVTVVVAIVVAGIILIWLAIVIFSTIRRKRILSGSDCKKVINYALVSSLKLLSAYGLKLKNTLPSDYIGEIQSLISEDYANDYDDTINIWLESLYSDNLITSAQKNSAVDFYNQTRSLIFKKSNVINKFKIKFIKLL
jgi:hypothetical protein